LVWLVDQNYYMMEIMDLKFKLISMKLTIYNPSSPISHNQYSQEVSGLLTIRRIPG